MKAIPDGQILALFFELTRGHGLAGHHQVMQPAASRKPRIQGGAEYVGGVSQGVLGVFLGQKLQKAFG